MKIVHLSDLHLGLRQYQRQTQNGINQREADVANAFRRAIDRIIELKPDVVLIGGDIFHAVRPGNTAILHAYWQFSKLTQSLPDAIIVMIEGNHDKPRTREAGNIIRLFSSLGITVVDTEPKRMTFLDGELSIFAVPALIRPRPAYTIDKTAKYNVLLTHDEVEGVIKRYGSLAERGGDLTLKELNLDDWDYVAFGHYHVYRKLAENAYYSGSIEYSGTNIWGEVDDEKDNPVQGKGFIVRDLATRVQKFEAIPLVRRVVDLPSLQGAGLTASELSDAICSRVDACEGGIDDLVVRLVVWDVPRHILRDLDHRKIREFKRRALHFLLDARRPQPVRLDAASGGPGRRASLTDTVRAMLEKRDITPGIDRKSLVDLGLHYLNEADRLAPAITGDEA